MSQRNLFFTVLGITALCLLLSIVHYFFFLESYTKAPIGTRSPYEFNAVIARYYHFDSMIMGTSMSQNFKCSEFDDKVGHGFSYKLTVPGCKIEKMCTIVEYACKYQKIRTVLADLHNQLVIEMPRGKIPDDVYYDDNNFWGHVRDGASLKTLKERRVYYSDEYKARKKGKQKKAFSRDDLYSWADEYPCGKLYLARELQIPSRPADPMQKPEYAEINIKRFIVPMVQNHPEIKFYFYLPPFSLFAYAAQEDITAARKPIMDHLLNLPNVELYDFQAADLILNLDNYKDMTHYSAEINSWILDQIQAGKYRVTQENRHEFEARFEARRKAFDVKKEKAALEACLIEKR